MGKHFPAFARHAKAREFLELKQVTMIVLEYVAKFIELAHFADDYVAIDIAKVRKFKNGLKLFTWGKIVGLLLQDMDLMVKTAMAIKSKVDEARSIRDTGVKDKRKESQPSSSAQGRSGGLLLRKGFRDRARTTRANARVNHPKMEDTSRLLASQGRGHVSLPLA